MCFAKPVILGFIFLSSCFVGVSAKVPTTSPNILFIFVDDMGWADLGTFGSDLYETPHIDQLATSGKKYTQAYTAAPICSPTRASVVTGQHPARLTITDWIPGHSYPHEKLQVPNWNNKGLEASDITIGELLQQQGYKTAWLGKWHLRGWPEEQAKTLDDDPKVSETAKYHGFDYALQDWNLNSDKRPNDPKGVDELTNDAIEFIEKHKQQPWFLTISHYSVHGPVRYNPDVEKRYRAKLNKGKFKQTNAQYAAMVDALDKSVGKVTKYLKDNNLVENTLVVFYSDNGGQNKKGKKGPTNNWPLRDGKGSLYEGGVRVPFIASWPGKITAGSVSEDLVTSNDILPTFAKVAGVKEEKIPEEVDGIDLSASLFDNQSPARQSLYWHYPHYHNLGKPAGAIRDGNYKLIEFFQTGKVELYDLNADLGEQTNIAKQQPKVTAKLLAKLTAWRDKVDAQMMTENPNYNQKKARHK